MDELIVARQGAVATVRINRPPMNLLNKAQWSRLRQVFQSLSAAESLRGIFLRGTGERAFSAGADIHDFERERSNVQQACRYGEVMHAALEAVDLCRHPTIALIHGVCVGGGLELACVCDLRICGQSSRFGVPVNQIGVVMAYPELAGLMRLVGYAAALEIVLEGRVFGAEWARQKGLVTRVVPDGEVEKTGRTAMRHITRGAPLVNRWHKKFARRLLKPAPLTPQELEEGFASAGTQDYREGYRAFLEKRKPRFRGK